MSGAISACENVCRDFSWLANLGQLSIPAAIGSATALLIAFVAYPWQKERDRKLQLNLEKRQAYKSFFASFLDLLPAAQSGTEDDFTDAVIATRKNFNGLAFYAPLEIVADCRNVIEKVMEYRRSGDAPAERSDHIFNEALQLEKYAIAKARSDILGLKDEDSDIASLIYPDR